MKSSLIKTPTGWKIKQSGDDVLFSVKKFCLVPRKCSNSNKWLWFTYGYKYSLRKTKTRMNKFNNREFYDIHETIWISSKEHLINLLKQ